MKIGNVVSLYGLLITLSVALAVLLCNREARRKGLPPDTGTDMALWAVPPAIVGARLYYVAFSWELYADEPLRALYFWEGGLAIYGAVIGGFLGLCLLARRRRVRLALLLDLAAPVVLLGQAIGRWGNFFNGEAYGAPVTNPALQFFPLSVYADGAWRQATFFYESCWDALGVCLLWIYRRRSRREGNVTLVYLLWYGLGRAVIEGMRSDSLMWGGVRVSQALSLLLCLLAAALLLRRRKKAGRPEAQP